MPILRMHRECGCALFLLWVVAAFDLGEAADTQEDRMVACEPKTCGSGPRVSFPFWIDGQHPRYCGLPAFKINCQDSSSMLPISGDDYTVQNISYDRSTIELIKRVPEATNHCSSFPNRNLTLERTPFNVSNTSNTSLFFYYHCNRSRLLQPPLEVSLIGLAPLPCDQQDVAFQSFVGYSLLLPQLGQALLPRACSTIVNLSIDPFHQSLGTITTYRQLLDFRITLRWMTTECANCENSGGRCGTNFTENNNFNFICICKDRDHRVKCDGRQTIQNKWKGKIIGSAVGGAGGVAVLAVVAVLCWRHFKPTKRSASLSKLIRSASTESYSMERDAEALSQTHIFSYKELAEATEGFADMNELGDGGFGTVYKGKLRDGRVVAIKRLYENNFKREEQFLNEVAILNRLRHKNLVSLYGCTSRHSRGLLLVYEYVPNGTVADHLHGSRVENEALTWHVRMNIAVETAGALAYLHAVEIIHRDVKTNNILLDENYHVKVADFGLSRLFPPDATHVSTVPQGTPGYLDPEYHQCYQLTDKSDVYSFGVVLAELISSKPAVDITRKRNEINLANMAISRIQNCQLQELVDPLLGYNSDDTVRSMIEQVAELAFRCLQAEKEMRPSMEEVLEVLKGITGVAGGTRKEHNHLGGKVDQDRRKLTDDSASLLNGSVQYSPDTVHADWVSITTTPNASS